MTEPACPLASRQCVLKASTGVGICGSFRWAAWILGCALPFLAPQRGRGQCSGGRDRAWAQPMCVARLSGCVRAQRPQRSSAGPQGLLMANCFPVTFLTVIPTRSHGVHTLRWSLSPLCLSSKISIGSFFIVSVLGPLSVRTDLTELPIHQRHQREAG